MPVSDNLSANIEKLNLGNQKKARQALKEGAAIFEDELRKKVPVDDGSGKQKGKLKAGVMKSGVKDRGGNLEVDVGYNKSVGWRARFPNSGTIFQDPQHFEEEAMGLAKDKVLQAFMRNLKL